jgi:hypothetical protein
MSFSTKANFKTAVSANHAAVAQRVSIGPPEFIDDGYITIAKMHAVKGVVELRCGPAEYHVELIVYVNGNRKRLTLADIIAIPSVREWMETNRPEVDQVTRIQAEVKYAFRLISEALLSVPDLRWLSRNDA